MIDGLGLMTYRERLDKLNLTTLLERRVRGHLIEMFKIQETLFVMALICLVVRVGLLLLGQRLIGLPQGRLTSLPRGSSATGISCLLTLNVVSR